MVLFSSRQRRRRNDTSALTHSDLVLLWSGSEFEHPQWAFLPRQVIDEFDENMHFVEIDIEEDPEIAEAAGIMGTPCVQFYKNKELIRTVSGVKMKKDYREFIDANK